MHEMLSRPLCNKQAPTHSPSAPLNSVTPYSLTPNQTHVCIEMFAPFEPKVSRSLRIYIIPRRHVSVDDHNAGHLARRLRRPR